MAGKGSKVKFSKRDDDKCKDEICKDCGIIIERTTKALSCNFCHKWVCTNCLEVADDLYKVLVKNPTSLLLVPCKDCGSQLSSLQDMRETLNEVKNSQSTTNSQLDTLRDNTNRQYEDLSKKMDTLSIKLKQTVQKAVKEEVGRQLDCKLVEVERKVKTSMEERLKDVQSQEEINVMITEAIKEDKEREKRKPNLMMFHLPESNSPVLSERINHDKKAAISVLRWLDNMDDIEARIKKVLRMGRRNMEISSSISKRPLKIVFDQPGTKVKFLQKAYKLDKAEDVILKDIRISSDRTPKEMELYRQLKLELEKRKAEGEINIKIQKGKIVNFRTDDESHKELSRDRATNSQRPDIERQVPSRRFGPGDKRLGPSRHDGTCDISDSDSEQLDQLMLNLSKESVDNNANVSNGSHHVGNVSNSDKFIPVLPLDQAAKSEQMGVPMFSFSQDLRSSGSDETRSAGIVSTSSVGANIQRI